MANSDIDSLIISYFVTEARNDFWTFCQFLDPIFFTDEKWHLREIATVLQEMEDGKCTHLAISLPPRAGKSYIVTMFCAWVLGRGCDGSLMRNSYAADLANKFSGDVMAVIEGSNYGLVFPEIKLLGHAKEGWSVKGARDMSYFCAGVGGPILGKGCSKYAILDDPIKNIEEALSPIVLENVWQWYTSTHLSRLETGCKEIQIATRWSRNDVIGRLTDEESAYYKGDRWRVIVVPAMIEGRSFCEEVHTTEEYLALRAVTDDFIWEAEYMQNPVEVKGLLYPPDELKRFDEIVDEDGVIAYIDPADQGNDFTCAVVGKRKDEFTYITDVYVSREGVEVTIPLIAQMLISTGCQTVKVESNAGGKLYADELRNLLKGRCYCRVIFEPNLQNKETRILMNSGYIKQYFSFRRGYKQGSDYDVFMRQLTSYVRMGKNKNDDCPDALTGLATYMQKSFKTSSVKPIDSRISIGGKYFESELLMKGLKRHEISRFEKKGLIEVIGK